MDRKCICGHGNAAAALNALLAEYYPFQLSVSAFRFSFPFQLSISACSARAHSMVVSFPDLQFCLVPRPTCRFKSRYVFPTSSIIEHVHSLVYAILVPRTKPSFPGLHLRQLTRLVWTTTVYKEDLQGEARL